MLAVRSLLVFALACLALMAADARAQRLANGRPSGIAARADRRIDNVASAKQPTLPSSGNEKRQLELLDPPEEIDPPPAKQAVKHAVNQPDASKLQIDEPAAFDLGTEPGAETDADDRFHFGIGKGLGLGLGRFCRPRFGLAFGLGREWEEPEQMVGKSWLSRPLHVDAFTGVMYGATLIEDNVRHQGDLFSGIRLGWDWTRRLGGEMRLGFAQTGTEDIANGVELADTDIMLWDLNVLWYPTGDTRLRPYLSIGLGAAHFEFEDAQGVAHQKELVGIPLAMGLKYRATPTAALRLDLANNLTLPNAGVAGQSNLSITVGGEFHFGGQRTSYWPWNPTLQAW